MLMYDSQGTGVEPQQSTCPRVHEDTDKFSRGLAKGGFPVLPRYVGNQSVTSGPERVCCSLIYGLYKARVQPGTQQ